MKVKYLIKCLLHKLKHLYRFIYYIWDLRLNRKLYVKKSGKTIFKISDYGKVTRMRAKTFFIKEPETIDWIDDFNDNENFMDIGANIGIYSLYASKKDHKVVAIEPDALNFALLNLNLRENNLSNKVTAYCLAMHDREKFSSLNISSYEWGGALNSFDRNKDFLGNEFQPIHKQGVYGTSVDNFLKDINFSPSHIKIDVDGNENLILKGASETLQSKELLSLLVELDESSQNYSESLNLILNKGFKLISKNNGIKDRESYFSTTYNHIFKRY